MANGDASERRLMIVVISAFILSILLLLGAMAWIHLQIQEKREIYDRKYAEFERNLREIQKAEGVSSLNKKLEQLAGNYDSWTVYRSDIPTVLRDVTKQLQSEGLVIAGCRLVPRKPEPKSKDDKDDKKDAAEPQFETVTYQWDVSGTFEQLLEFIQAIEDPEQQNVEGGGRLFEIRNPHVIARELGFQGRGEEADGHDFSFQLVFYVRAGEPKPSDEDAAQEAPNVAHAN